MSDWLVMRRLVQFVCVTACLFGQPAAYRQSFRPQFHFSPRQNWTNDPNGVVYFEGEYHLFYQYNPFGDEWGHMSWGHAVSRDLVHWQELPVAIPEAGGIMIFTGSTVVDERNTSGFCTAGRACLVAVYTGHRPASGNQPVFETQNLAYSNDRGRTWTKYAGNPVLDLHMKDFRDPHVFWSEEARRWVMAVALPNEHKVVFYGSGDLKKWERMSEFGPAGTSGGQWECPTLTRVPVAGASGEARWVLKVGVNPGGLQGGSGEQYFVGDFDGARFTNRNDAAKVLWTDFGKDCYCALTFNGMPRGEAPVMIGWMDNWQYAGKTPTNPWRGQMTIPRRVQLKNGPEGLRLAQAPVETVERLRGERIAWGEGNAAELNRALKRAARWTSFELHSTVTPGPAGEVGWRLLAADGKSITVGYGKGQLFVDRTNSGVTDFSKDFPARTAAAVSLENGKLELTVLVDRSTVEVFAQGGLVAMTNLVYPAAGAGEMEFYGDGARVKVEAWELKTAWE